MAFCAQINFWTQKVKKSSFWKHLRLAAFCKNMNRIRSLYLRGSWTSKGRKHINRECSWCSNRKWKSHFYGSEKREHRNRSPSAWCKEITLNGGTSDPLWNSNGDKSEIDGFGGIFLIKNVRAANKAERRLGWSEEAGDCWINGNWIIEKIKWDKYKVIT